MAILEKKKIIPNFSDIMKKIKQWTTLKRKPVSVKTSISDTISDWKIVGNDMRRVLEDFEDLLKYYK